jgi:hypothetical protein
LNRVRVRRGDIEIELEGEASFLEAHLDRLMAMAFGRPVAEPAEEMPRVAATFTVRRNLSFEDFLDLKDPETDRDRLLVLAYFQEKYQSRGHYTVPELRGYWEEAWPALPWDDDVWKEALEAGFLQWQDGGQLTLSFAGQNYVRDGLA